MKGEINLHINSISLVVLIRIWICINIRNLLVNDGWFNRRFFEWQNIRFLLTIHNSWKMYVFNDVCSIVAKRVYQIKGFLFHKLESNDNFVHLLRSFCLESFWIPPMSLPRKKIAGDSENRWDLAIFLLILYLSFRGKHRGTKLNENCKIFPSYLQIFTGSKLKM